MVRARGINSASAVAVTSDVGSFTWCLNDTSCLSSGAIKTDAPVYKGASLKGAFCAYQRK